MRPRQGHRMRCALVALFAVLATACDDDAPNDADTLAASDTRTGGGDGSVDPGDTASPSDTTPPPDGGGTGRTGLFAPSVTEVALEIDYETGAAPFVRGGTRLDDPWTLFENNAAALFGSAKTVTVPHTLDGMEALGELPGEDYDVDALLAIADAHRDDPGTASRRVFYVVFLDGWFMDAEGRQENVLGVSIGNRGVIAMFKPVIAGSVVEAFVEQTTLVHEFGHAIGLVANGIATTSAHHDAEHGAHCTNRNCVMYYLNEGASDMVQFVVGNVTSGDTVVFGDECLDDVAAAIVSGTP